MKYIIKQYESSEIPDENWKKNDHINLGGFFYDYLLSKEKKIIGVRYWMNEKNSFKSNPIFISFSKDSRFIFNKDENFVDILFLEEYLKLYKSGCFNIDYAQDFGGDIIISNGKYYGIIFDIILNKSIL